MLLSTAHLSTPNTEPLIPKIKEIAEELAYDYFSNSFGDDANKSVANCHNIFKAPGERQEGRTSIEERWSRHERVRNILVVGAGAIYDAYTAIPKGKEFMEEIDQIFDINRNRILKEKFAEEAKILKLSQPAPGADL